LGSWPFWQWSSKNGQLAFLAASNFQSGITQKWAAFYAIILSSEQKITGMPAMPVILRQ